MKSSKKWIVRKEQMWNKRKIVKMDSKFTGRKSVARSRQVCMELELWEVLLVLSVAMGVRTDNIYSRKSESTLHSQVNLRHLHSAQSSSNLPKAPLVSLRLTPSMRTRTETRSIRNKEEGPILRNGGASQRTG
jgi:hypothetical protein